MFGQRKVTCAICRIQVPRKEALRGHDQKDVAVCRTCYGQWDRVGGKCAGCQTPVRGAQEVGVFLDRRALGHADCGAVRLTR